MSHYWFLLIPIIAAIAIFVGACAAAAIEDKEDD